MLTNLVSIITKSFVPTPATAQVTVKNSNPFSSEGSNNTFFGSGRNNSASYAKNQPIEGGYFAGYYNNKPNIVGRKLFIEV